MNLMTRAHGRIRLTLIAAALIWSCRTAALDGLVFPVPDRPVAPIVSPKFSDERARDERGEARKVMERLGIEPGVRVADIGAGEGYYTVRLVRRLGAWGAVYAQDVRADYLRQLKARLGREGIRGVEFVRGTPNDPKLAPDSVDIALLSYMYHEIENPYEFLYRLRPALSAHGRVGIIEVDRPTQDHGTPLVLLRCELEAVGYRQIDFMPLEPADRYLAIFLPPAVSPPVSSIKPCKP
jgi:SAM-dependent methyltransferase